MSQMEFPVFEEQPAKSSGSAHNTIQSVAAAVTALAAVAAAISSSRDRTVTWILVAVCVIAVLVMLWPFVQHMTASAKKRKKQSAKDRAAKEKYPELVRLAVRFGQFTKSGDPTNILQIIQSSCSNDMEKSSQVCPPDYLSDFYPIFLQQLRTRPAENERQFFLAIEELQALIASYNREYVSEPFRKMRSKQWPMTNPSALHQTLGNANPSNPNLGPWLYSLPQSYQENAARNIEDFRERWAGFLEEMKQWLESINESFGVSVSTHFERPKKL